MSILGKIKEQGYQVRTSSFEEQLNNFHELQIEKDSLVKYYKGDVYLNMIIVEESYHRKKIPETIEEIVYEYWEEKAKSLDKILLIDGFERYKIKSEKNFVEASKKLLDDDFTTYYVQECYQKEIHVFESFLVEFKKTIKEIRNKLPLFEFKEDKKVKIKGYYFSSNIELKIEVKNNQCFLSMYEKGKENVLSIPLQSTKDITKEVMNLLERIKKNNRVKHLMNNDKHFLNSFCEDRNMEEISDSLYSELTRYYTSLQIEEIAWDYINGKRKKDKKPIKFRNKVQFFSFDDHYFVADLIQNKVREVENPTQEKIKEILVDLYKERAEEDFKTYQSRLEKWDIW